MKNSTKQLYQLEWRNRLAYGTYMTVSVSITQGNAVIIPCLALHQDNIDSTIIHINKDKTLKRSNRWNQKTEQSVSARYFKDWNDLEAN